MVTFGLHGVGDPFIVVLAALAGDMLLGWIPGVRMAFDAVSTIAGQAAAWFETRLNRPNRAARSRAARGIVVMVIFAVAGAAIGLGARRVVAVVPEGWMVEAALVALLLGQRRVFDKVRAVARALDGGVVAAARAALAPIVSHDTAVLDVHGVARGAAQVCARNVCDGIVAPVFWYLLLGLPGLCVYRSVNVLAQAIGHPSPRLADFGRAASGLNSALNYPPALIGGVFVVVAALFVPTASPLRALRTMVRDGGGDAPDASAWTQRAVAGALGVALGGPTRYDGAAVGHPWIGDGRARATARDITRTAFLFAVAGLLAMATVALLRLATV